MCLAPTPHPIPHHTPRKRNDKLFFKTLWCLSNGSWNPYSLLWAPGLAWLSTSCPVDPFDPDCGFISFLAMLMVISQAAVSGRMFSSPILVFVWVAPSQPHPCLFPILSFLILCFSCPPALCTLVLTVSTCWSVSFVFSHCSWGHRGCVYQFTKEHPVAGTAPWGGEEVPGTVLWLALPPCLISVLME